MDRKQNQDQDQDQTLMPLPKRQRREQGPKRRIRTTKRTPTGKLQQLFTLLMRLFNSFTLNLNKVINHIPYLVLSLNEVIYLVHYLVHYHIPYLVLSLNEVIYLVQYLVLNLNKVIYLFLSLNEVTYHVLPKMFPSFLTDMKTKFLHILESKEKFEECTQTNFEYPVQLIPANEVLFIF